MMHSADHAMGSGWPPDCVATAPLLALRETGLLDTEESARVERHLATCAACQRETALDGALAGRMRRALLAPAGSAVPALTLRDIRRAASQADSSAAPLDDIAASPTRPARPAPQPPPAGRHWPGGLAAIAAAIVVFAIYVFGAMPRTGGVARVEPTATLDPALAQRTVYIAAEQGLYALRASDGAVRWAYHPTTPTTTASDQPMISSMALDGDTLYGLASFRNIASQPNSTLLALDARTGAVRWKERIPGQDWASLLKIGNLLIVSPYVVRGPYESDSPFNQTVLAYSAATGRAQWSRALSEQPLAKPTAAGGALYVATSVRLISLDAATGAVRWTTPIVPSASQQGAQSAPYNSSAALAAAGSYVFALTTRDVQTGATDNQESNLYEIAAADGTHIARSGAEKLVQPGSQIYETTSAPTAAGNQLFAAVFDGLSAFTIGASPALQWRFIAHDAPDGNVSLTGASYANGVVYVTSMFDAVDNNVTYSRSATYAVRAADGAQLWRSQTYATGDLITPVAGSGVVFTTSYGALLALRASNGQRLWKYPASSGAVGGVYAVQFG